jgi:aminomethyltransferase
MGEIEVSGAGALELCQELTVNDVGRIKQFQAQYNLMLNDAGGVVDDVIVYRTAPDVFFICVNASNSDKDYQWIKEHAGRAVAVANLSDRYAQLALQGPIAEEILQPLTALALGEMKSFNFAFGDVGAVRCLVARTGYTGEAGFELYCDGGEAEKLWNTLMEAGTQHGLVPVGLGARDTLRLEKAYPLYGHELDDTTTPLEAGLEWVIKFSKNSFIGRDVLAKQKEQGLLRELVGLELLEPGIARGGHALLKNDEPVGRVTSGTMSPSLKKSIALAYLASAEAPLGNLLDVEIRGRKIRCKTVAVPFYRSHGKA